MLEIGLFCFIATMSSFGALIRVLIKGFRRAPNPSRSEAVRAQDMPANCPACTSSLPSDIELCKYCGNCGARCVA